MFARGLLDKLKVEPEVFRREEYKAAMAPLTQTGFDPAQRENITSLLQVGIAAAKTLFAPPPLPSAALVAVM